MSCRKDSMFARIACDMLDAFLILVADNPPTRKRRPNVIPLERPTMKDIPIDDRDSIVEGNLKSKFVSKSMLVFGPLFLGFTAWIPYMFFLKIFPYVSTRPASSGGDITLMALLALFGVAAFAGFAYEEGGFLVKYILAHDAAIADERKECGYYDELEKKEVL